MRPDTWDFKGTLEGTHKGTLKGYLKGTLKGALKGTLKGTPPVREPLGKLSREPIRGTLKGRELLAEDSWLRTPG